MIDICKIISDVISDTLVDKESNNITINITVNNGDNRKTSHGQDDSENRIDEINKSYKSYYRSNSF